MKIELKEIDKDTLKVGDWVGVARKVSCGWSSSFRHELIFPAQITRITPKRTKFFTDKFGEHDKREVFYECDSEAEKEGITGFMYGVAVSILSQCWEYGEFLRKWHNKEYGYDGDGVVNPAVITVG